MTTFPPKKILVPLDLSDGAFEAWRQALDLSRRFGSELEGLYVQDWLPSVLGYPGARLGRQLRGEILRQLRDKVGDGRKLHVVEGDPAERIASLARGGRFDLVLMGTHGRSGAARLLMGSVAEEVLRRSSVPVWAVRRRLPKIRSVLAPVNFTRYSGLAFRCAADVARAFGARLAALHVAETWADRGTGRTLLRDLARVLADGLRTSTELAVGDPATEIARAARHHSLVVLSAHRRSFLSDTVLGTTAERVLRHAPAGVLAVPSEAKRRRR